MHPRRPFTYGTDASKTTHRYHNKMFFKFYDKPEAKFAPEKRQHGQHVFEMVKNIHVVFRNKNPDGMKRDRSTPPVPDVAFKKPIYFQLYGFLVPFSTAMEIHGGGELVIN